MRDFYHKAIILGWWLFFFDIRGIVRWSWLVLQPSKRETHNYMAVPLYSKYIKKILDPLPILDIMIFSAPLILASRQKLQDASFEGGTYA